MATDVTAAPGVRRTRSEGLSISRYFTQVGVDPLSQIEWETRRSEIKSPDGKKVIFEMPEAECPKAWSQTALDIAADKYFRKAGVPTPSGKETSVRAMVNRVAKAIRLAGEKQGGYFATVGDADAFEHELRYLLANQFGAFNSPVWFNVGMSEAYGIKGKSSENYVWNHETASVSIAEDSYSRPAASACFIVSVEDDLLDIARHVEREMRIFRFGGGSGGNYSRLRAEGEALSNGGVSSGLMSFLKVFDVSAGAIKSGGTTRRAAKLVCLDADHPDIEKFIDWKVREEDKALALIKAGYPRDFNGEAYQTVSGQNANNSVRLTDEFMQAVIEDKPWQTKWRTSGKVASTLSAKKLFRKIAEAAWRCADPGLMFDTTINKWNPVINTGRIEAANPCFSGRTLVSTTKGLVAIEDLVGQSADLVVPEGVRRTTEVFCTGVKPVFLLRTKSGYTLEVTEDHPIWAIRNGSGSDRAASQLREGDKLKLVPGRFGTESVDRDLAFAVGYAVGNGCVADGVLIQTAGDDHRDLMSWLVSDLNARKAAMSKAGADARSTRPCSMQSVPTGVKVATATRDIVSRFESFAVLDQGSEKKVFKPTALQLDRDSTAAMLRGLFSSDGTVVCDGDKNAYVGLDSVSLDLIRQVQQLLLCFGIKSKIYEDRRGGKKTEILPDGKGGMKKYDVKESHSLRITRSSRVLFEQMIGFHDLSHKSESLRSMNESVGAYKDVLEDEFESLDLIGEMAVYDLREPSTHHFVAGGIYVHNCNEFHFLQNTACNLSSLNIMKFMEKKNGAWRLNVAAFRHAARLFTLAKEIIVDYASYPTREIAQNSHDYRPLGLGYANLGAALMVQGVPYDSVDGCAFAAALNSVLCGVAYETSAEVAASKGPFPGFAHNREPMLKVLDMHRAAAAEIKSERYSDIAFEGLQAWNTACRLAEKHGVRNGQTTVTAPTGTIGLMMDCDTTGVEPDFSLVKHKKLAGGGYLKIVNRSVDPALEALGYTDEQRAAAVKHVLEHGTLEGWADMKPEHLPIFDCANRCGDGKRYIEPMGHIRMLAAVQPFVSGSISKTVNCPNETTVDEIEALYMEAWKRGLKCLAIYRDGSKHAQVLDTSKKDEKAAEAKATKAAEAAEAAEAAVAAVAAAAVADVSPEVTERVVAAPRPMKDDRSNHGPPPTQRHRLPKERPGGFALELTVGGQKLYLRTGEYTDGSIGELFIDMHKDGSTMRSMTNMFAIAVSLGLQHGVPIREFVDAFTFMKFEPHGPVDHPNVKMATSVVDAIFRILAFKYLGEDGLEYVQKKPTDEELAEMRGRKALLLAANGKAPAKVVTMTAGPGGAGTNVVAVNGNGPVNGNGSYGKNGTGSYKRSMVEAQTCSRCGNLTVRTGTCSTCTACGLSSGCA